MSATGRNEGQLPLIPLAVLLAAMVACSTLPAEPSAEGGAAMAACNADGARGAIGQAPTEAVVERARVESGSQAVRVLRPGQAVTMDYRGDRLSIDVNERGAITGLRCG